MTGDFQPKPGRPKGTGLDDTRVLAEMAAALCEGTEATVAGAIRRAAPDAIADPATVRRLQRKFAEQRESLMAAHRAATEAERRRTARRGDARAFACFGAVLAVFAAVALAVGTVWGLHVGGFVGSLAFCFGMPAALAFGAPQREVAPGGMARDRLVRRAVRGAVAALCLALAVWPLASGAGRAETAVVWATAFSVAAGYAATSLIGRARFAEERMPSVGLAVLGGVTMTVAMLAPSAVAAVLALL